MDYVALIALLALLVCPGTQAARPPAPYFGRLIGNLSEYAHGVSGMAYAVDDATVFIRRFTYDGTGPDAFFWVGDTARPSPDGLLVPYPDDYKGRDPPKLRAHHGEDVILRLPAPRRLRDVRWLAVWCRRFTVNFGDVFVPAELDVPRARVLPEFRRLAHGLRSGNISVLDARTIYIPNLHYDGAGPDAYFWVGNGSQPSQHGRKVPNEVGSLEPLKGYQGEDIEIVLPGDLTVHDIDWLAVWCVQYRHNFGHVLMPKDLDVPPALGQTKITPPWWYNPTSSPPPAPAPPGNCRSLLGDRLQVTWELRDDMLVIELSARLREDQYMAFGLSGEPARSAMVGADVAVAFYDADARRFRAVDYYISASAQCDGKGGVCPDERIGGRNDVEFLDGSRSNGVTTVRYQRPLQTNEPIKDRAVPLDTEVSVVAAIGPLNARKEANAHAVPDKTTEDIRIDFSAVDDASCLRSLLDVPEEPAVEAWPPHVIAGVSTFSVRIGPTGGKRGYTPVTGQVSWGIAWYLNDLLIPEIYVERGKTYVFIVEGGSDPTNPARYHPFYITDNKEGGFGQKSNSEQARQRVYAGVGYDNQNYPVPTAAGRYCEWTHKTVDRSLETASFSEYVKTLRLMCEEGEPAFLNWTVPLETPNLLYYQCYTHSNLGWKINVVDPGFTYPGAMSSAAASLSMVSLASMVSMVLMVSMAAIPAAR